MQGHAHVFMIISHVVLTVIQTAAIVMINSLLYELFIQGYLKCNYHCAMEVKMP